MLSGASFVKRDIIRFYYPVWKFSVQTLKSGIFPLWNPYNSCGAPFFADIQTTVLYPLSLILYLPDYRWAFNFYILVHLALAGFFTCVWMRDCGASRAGSFLAGLSFALGGYTLSAISLTISLVTLVYFPLVLLTLRRSLRSAGFFWKAVTALVLLVQYFGGDPAIFFATLVVCTLFVLYKTAVGSFRAGRPCFRYLSDYAKIVALFLGLSAFHTLLFFEFLRNSNRALLGYDDVTMWSVQYNDLVSIFFPYFSDLSIVLMDYWVRQSWLENAYAGVTVLLLGFFALKAVRKNDLVGYHALLALFGLALALGRFCAVYDMLYHGFPFFKFIRYPVRFLFIFSFAAACLAGFGLDEVLSRLRRRRASLLPAPQASLAALCLVSLVALVILSMAYSVEIESAACAKAKSFLSSWMGWEPKPAVLQDLVRPVLFNAKRTAVLIGLALTGVLAAWHFKPRRTLLAVFFSLIVFADLAGVNVIEIQLDGEVLSKPSRNLERVSQDTGVYRVLASPQSVKLQYQPPGLETFDLTLAGLRETLTPNLLLPYRISDVSGYDSIFLQDSIDVNDARRNIQDPTRQRFFDMLNIKYMVSPKQKIGGAYRLVQQSYPVNLFLNERVLPRAYLVPNAEVVNNRSEILKKITDPAYDPEKTIYLEEVPENGGAGPERTASVRDEARLLEYSPNRVRLAVDSKNSQWLFLSDLYYPGWRATLDGKPLRTYRANYAFRAVRVPAGGFSLEWNYDPILFKIGGAISLSTLLGIGTYFLSRLYRRRLRSV